MNLDWKDRRVRGAVFVVMHLAALATIVELVVLPIREFFADRDARIADQRIQLARFEGIASQAANVGGMAHHVDPEAQKGEFLVGPSDGLIGAELQTRLKGFTESAGAHVRSAQNLPAKHRNLVQSASRCDNSRPSPQPPLSARSESSAGVAHLS
jgi:hypothetical protein